MSSPRKLPDMAEFIAANPDMSGCAVARKFGVSPQAVSQAAIRAGVKINGRRARINTAKLPSADVLRQIMAAEPQLTAQDLADRFGCTRSNVYIFCKRHGIALAPDLKPFKQIRLNGNQAAVADAIVTNAAHRLTDFRMTVETSDDRAVIDAAISGLDDLSFALRSGDTSFLAGK